MTLPTGPLFVEFAFGYAPLNTAPVWQSVSNYVFDVNVNRGRQDEFSQYPQGTATVTLNNSSRIFDPYYTAGIYYGLLKPMTPVRIRNGGDIMFVGFVTAWPTDYDISNKFATSTVPCVDATRLLQNMVLNDCPFSTVVSADVTTNAYFQMQQAEVGQITSTTGQILPSSRVASLTTSNLPVGLTNTLSPTGINPTILFDGANSGDIKCECIEFFIDMTNAKTGGLTFFQAFRRRLQVTPGNWRGDYFYVGINDSGVLTTIVYQNYDTGQGYSNLAVGLNINLQVGSNYVVVQAGAGLVGVSVNDVVVFLVAQVALSTTFVLSSNLSISCGTGVSHVIFGSAARANITARYQAAIGFPNELTGARLTRILDVVGWPALWRSIENGVQNVGSYRPASQPTTEYMRQIENAEQGTLIINRVGDVRFESRTTTNTITPIAFFSGLTGTTYPFTGIEIDANDVDKIFNRIDANYESGTVSSTDSTSVTAYGSQLQNIDLSLMSTKSDATSATSALLAIYKDPRLAIKRLTINMLSNLATLEPLLPQLELGDDIVVIFQPNNTGTTIWACLKIQGLNHSVTPDSFFTSIYCGPSPIQTNGPLVVLDNTTYGTLTTTNMLA